MKVIIVGGVAGGASCAARLRRLDEKAEIVLVERGPYVSYANCGLPYHVGGVIEQESSLLVATEQMFRAIFAIDCRTRCEAVAISPKDKTVQLKNLATGELTTESYDKLVLSPGAAPIRPPLPGIDLPGIFSVRTVPDARADQEWIERDRSDLPEEQGYVGVPAAGHAEARGGGRRRLHRSRDGGEPGPSRARGDDRRDARPGHGAARPGVRPARRAPPRAERRPPGAQRRRGELRPDRERCPRGPHEVRQDLSGGPRDPRHRRAPGNRSGEGRRARDRPARRHPRRRADAHQRPGHLRRRRRGRGQGLRHRRVGADSARRAGEPAGPDRRPT